MWEYGCGCSFERSGVGCGKVREGGEFGKGVWICVERDFIVEFEVIVVRCCGI